MLSVPSTKNQDQSRVITLKNILLDNLRLGSHFGSVKMYSDSISSARSINLLMDFLVRVVLTLNKIAQY